MGTFANSEDPDEMPYNAAFHHGLHCLLYRQNPSSEKGIQYFLEIMTCDPSIYRYTILVCLMILYVPSTIFQLCRDGSS